MSETTDHSFDQKRRSSGSHHDQSWFGSPYTRASKFDESGMVTVYRPSTHTRFCARRFFASLLANERGQIVTNTLVVALFVLVLALVFCGLYTTRSTKSGLISVDSLQNMYDEELARQLSKLQKSLRMHVTEQLQVNQQLINLQLKEQYTNLMQEIRSSCNQYANDQKEIITKWQRTEHAFQDHLARLALKEGEFARRVDELVQNLTKSITSIKDDIKMSGKTDNKTIPIEEQFNFASAQYGASFVSSRSSATLRPKINNQLLDIFLKVETSKYPIIDRTEPLQPGECWCFTGHTGVYAVQLAAPVFIEKFEYIHTSWEAAGTPPLSAPRTLQLWGCDSPSESECAFLAECVYGLNSKSHKLTCYVDQLKNLKPVSFVEMRVTGNHGDEYTCLYSFRVFGTRYLQQLKIPDL